MPATTRLSADLRPCCCLRVTISYSFAASLPTLPSASDAQKLGVIRKWSESTSHAIGSAVDDAHPEIVGAIGPRVLVVEEQPAADLDHVDIPDTSVGRLEPGPTGVENDERSLVG